MEVSYRLQVVGRAPTHAVALPSLPGSESYEPGLIDRAGEQLQRSWPLVAAGGIAGGVIGSKLLRMGGGGIFRGLAGGIAGVLGGVAIGMGGLALARGNDAHRKPQASAAAPAASVEVAAREGVKVMTYNVHGGMGGPGKFGSSEEELDRLADVIRREQPDVLLLQEVDRFATRSNHTDVLTGLHERLGAESSVAAPAMTTIMGRDQHVAVMTFNGFTISDARNIVHADERGGGFGVRASAWLRDAKVAVGSVLGQSWDGGTRHQVRNTIEAMVRTPEGTDVRVLSGHYEWPEPVGGVDHQGRQVAPIAGALDAWRGPTIWGGDFNVQAVSVEGDRERVMMGSAGLVDAFEAVDPTRPVPPAERVTDPARPWHPGGGIDRIYVSEHARVLDARVAREAGDASDHLPVVARLELMPGSSI